jgi:uncharacterized protein YecE (DUF72 family)
LLQLPPTMTVDPEALEGTLACFPRTMRVAVEFRHASWFADSVRAVLERRRAALCLSDTAGRRPPLWRTVEWGYVRFHRGRASPAPCYGETALARWAERVQELWDDGDDVYCYFNNDTNGCAPRDAHRFALAARRHGLAPTRTPLVHLG